jgi:hypothetical protein
VIEIPKPLADRMMMLVRHLGEWRNEQLGAVTYIKVTADLGDEALSILDAIYAAIKSDKDLERRQ